MTMPVQPKKETELEEDRRKFLASCGKFAVVTPPALTILLSTSLNTEAIARSGGGMGQAGGGDPPGGGSGSGHDWHDHDWHGQGWHRGWREHDS